MGGERRKCVIIMGSQKSAAIIRFMLYLRSHHTTFTWILHFSYTREHRDLLIVIVICMCLLKNYSGGEFGPHGDFMQEDSEHFNQLSHDDFILDDFATSDSGSFPTRPPRPKRPIRHGFSRPPHPSSDHFSSSGFGHSSSSHGAISDPSMSLLYIPNYLYISQFCIIPSNKYWRSSRKSWSLMMR